MEYGADSCESSSGGGTRTVPGLYVCGWVKRGPTGIIGTNLIDAEDTVVSIVQDVESGTLGGGRGSGEGTDDPQRLLRELLVQRNARVVDARGWERINAEEVARGKVIGKAREKLTRVEDMLAVAGV